MAKPGKILAFLTFGLLTGSGASAGSDPVPVGAAPPDFRLQDQNGKWHTLADHRGKWIALYFYPKDQTPGCTKEACSFRDNFFAFEKLGALVLGVSLDDVKSHEEFAKKHSLPFPLLADPDGTVAKQFGVYRNLGIMKIASRQSFLIDPEGKLVKHYEKVDPAGHTAEILAELRSQIAARRPG